ncbi:MAG TPA: FTR1 family protein [Candidatus Didemnitutus sp.]|nr:FTR1 family protein [Candidatus Didemnitutus sp.]
MQSTLSRPIGSAIATPASTYGRFGRRLLIGVGVMLIAAVLAWQGITSAGNPDPTTPHTGKSAAILDIGVLVFREGLECILVLSAITASMVGSDRLHRRPVAAGAGLGFLATLITWFVAVGIVNDLTASFPALHVQAATGLLAVVVLLVVMNWFFHKVYWGGWIALHNRRKRDLLKEADAPDTTGVRLLWGMGLLGFSSLYREGFEVVLFLQSYRLRLGGALVLEGVLLGLFFTAIVAALTFVAHRRLPYRRMLVLTGILLGVVLLVMVGEEAQEMQLAHWIPTTNVGWLAHGIPAWMGLWFSIFPTLETLSAQAAAAVLVVGSYWLVRLPAARQQCQAECAAEPAAAKGESHCNPLCVSATVCRTLNSGEDIRKK